MLHKSKRSSSDLRYSRLAIEQLEARQLLSANPLITEFMASNSSTLEDYYGKYPDWLEIYNPDTVSVDLSGWKLKDSGATWSIPSGVTLASHGYLLVYCDDRDTVAPNGELHANFKLSADGEYLALLKPDNTVVSEYAPEYPQQIADVSYGVSTCLIGAGATASVLIPTDDSLGTTWQGSPANEPFYDYDWASGAIGAGYGSTTPEGNANLMLRISVSAESDLVNGTNTVNDISPANHDGTNVGNSVSWVDVSTDASAQPIQRYGVMQFNAAENDQITVGYHSDFYNTTAGTISFWMNSSGTTGTGDGAVLFDMRSTSRGMLITQTDEGYIRMRCYNNVPSDGTLITDVTSAAAVSDGNWHLVTVNFNRNSGGAYSIYIDGALSASGTNSVGWVFSPTTSIPLEIGRCSHTNHNPNLTLKNYNGLLDDFRFYNAQLNASQITNIYNGVDVGISAGDVGLNVQGLMQNVNTTAYIRIPFNVTAPSSITSLSLTMRYNDGFSAWINGQPVASANAPATLAWDSAATVHSMEGYYTFTIPVTPGMLLAGRNILAIQGLNYALGDGNFLILPQLDTDVITSGSGVYFTTPTPGAANSAGKTDLGPYVSDVTNIVAQPTGGAGSQPLTITATVNPSLRAISTVQIAYRVMFESETLATMYDNGTHGDVTAGDHIYTAVIDTDDAHLPSLDPGEMLRWRVIATDTLGAITTGPAFNDPTNSEQYYGTVAVDGVDTQLPMLQFFVQDYHFPTSTSDQTTVDTDAGARGAIFYLGEFYDNVLIRIKGMGSRYMFKRSHHVDFNSDHDFLWEEGQPRVKSAAFNSEYQDPSYVRQYLSLWLHQVSGTGATPDFPVRMQMNGEFWQLAFFNIPLNESLLKVMGYDPNGAMYKFCGQIEPGSAGNPWIEKRTREWEGDADYNALAYAINASVPAAQRAAAVYDMLDLPQVINYIAIARIVMECDDVWANMSIYRDSDGDGLWRIIPCDLNLSFGQMYAGEYSANSGIHANDDYLKAHPLYGGSEYLVIYHNGFFDYNQIYDAIMMNPDTRAMLLRRMRTLMDEYLQPPGTPYENRTLENMLDEFVARAGVEANLDKEKWGWPPQGGPYGMGTPTFEQAIEDIKTQYLDLRRLHMYVDHSLNTSYPEYADIPPVQQDGLTINFGSYDACPISGNQEEEYLTLVNPNDVAVDISGWKLTGGVEFTFASGTVIPAGGTLYVSPNFVAFKQRATGPSGGQGLFVVAGYDGRLSLRGENIQLLDQMHNVVNSLTTPADPSLAQQYLRITEIMYHPTSGGAYTDQDFEFVELKNTSTTQTLDLTGVRFTDGPVFDFTGSSVTSLAPGAKVLIVSNWAAFQSRYGTGLNSIIAGEYGVVTASILDPTHLSNSGEKIMLVDALGETILSFTYKDGWYKQTDGEGNSLVIRDPYSTDRDLWDQREGWAASQNTNGSPGNDETPQYAADVIVVNELLNHRTESTADWVEFYNTTGQSINIGGWYISNNDDDLKQYQIPANTYIEAHDYLVFDCDVMGFTMGEMGGTVYLTSASGGVLTGYQVSEQFSASDTGVTLGRYIKTTGGKDFVAMATPTPGEANSAPLVGPVVINEIYYHPSSGDFSFIELKNITGEEVLLYDSSAPENTWKLTEGVNFIFPQGATIPAYGYALIVECDPTFFRTKYNIPVSVPIYGPYIHKLDNAGDTVELKYPGDPQPDGDVPYYRVDQVTYEDSGLWPTLADGAGASLNRISATAYGNEATNWTAGYPTPGADYAEFITDPITIITPAAATPSNVTGNTTNLSVIAEDILGEATILYDWSVNSMPAGATYPTFSANDTNAAKNTTATFYNEGEYTFNVTLADLYGGVITSSVNVTVIRTLAGFAITPAARMVAPGGSIQFNVYGMDQFGDTMGTPLSNITWTVYSGVGSISSDGLYIAPVDGSGVANIRAITSTGQILYANVTFLSETVWYPANATSGATLADASGNGNDATLSGAAAFGAGISGNALYLTGGYASLPTGVVSTLNDFTIAAWVKIDTLSTWSRIFDFGTGTTVNMFLTPLSGSGNLRFAITTSGGGGEQQINGASALATGVWQHVAVTLSGTTGTLYVNGVAVGTNSNMTLRPSSLGSTTQNYLGDSQYSADPALLGSIDDFRIIDRALSADEIRQFIYPTIITAASAGSVTSASAVLSVLGADVTGGESGLTYTWSVTGTPPAPVTFSTNGANAAKTTTATFTKAGTYSFLVTATNAAGFSATSTVNVTIDQMPKNIAVSPSGGSQLTVTGTDQFGDALPSSAAFAWPAAGLTLQLAADGYLHLYQSGTTTDVVAPYAEAGLNSVAVTGLNGAAESLTVDLSGGEPIPAGGITLNGGTGGGNSLFVIGAPGGNSVVMSAAEITDNGLAPIYYSNVTYFGFNLVGGSNSLSINNATLKINQNNAISADTDVTIDGGTLDLGGKTDTIGSLLLKSGSVINGVLYAGSYVIESGTVTATISGPGSLEKTTSGQATTETVNAANVTVTAGQLTATYITTGTLTVGAGGKVVIAPIVSDPPQALSAQNTSANPLLTDGFAPLSATTGCQAAATNTTLTSPSTNTESAALALSFPEADGIATEPLALPVINVAYTASNRPVIDYFSARQVITTFDSILARVSISSPLDSTTFYGVIETRLDNHLGEIRSNNTQNSLYLSAQSELSSRLGMIKKHAYLPAMTGRRFHFAAVDAIVQNTRWNDTNEIVDFDIAPHVRAEKHSKPSEKAIDEALAEEDAIAACLSTGF
jgi:hypothetical protein